MPPVDVNKLIQAAVVVIVVGFLLLGLTYVIPLIGSLLGLAILGLVVYLIYLFLKSRGII